MYITFEDNKYYISCEYGQRETVKKLGFKWCSETKRWFTNNWWVAMKAPTTNKPIELLKKEKNIKDSSAKTSPVVVSHARLMPFQRAGYIEMTYRKNILLADEQGLGKTAQAITYFNNDGAGEHLKVLIICPASLKINWQREILKFATKGKFQIKILSHGKDKIGKSVLTGKQPNVVIVNYDLLKSKIIFDQLKEYKAHIIIGDEAHYLKNTKTSRTKLTAELVKDANKVIMITGTPVLNRPIELFPILKMISPETIAPYDDYRRFAYRFCAAHEGRWGFDATGASNVEELNDRLRATCMIRRLKKDVLEQLPDKQIQLVPFEQDKKTQKIIENKEFRFDIKTLKKNPERGNVGDLAKVRHELALAKLPASIEYICDLLESVDKLVVFAYHRDVIDHLYESLKSYGAVVLTGGMNEKNKQEAIDCFQNNSETRIFIGQIQAAGVGITLTQASDVVFVETSWVPGEIHQAIDRCHRIGQKSSVLARFLVVENSLDESMLKTIFDKEKVINKVINTRIM